MESIFPGWESYFLALEGTIVSLERNAVHGTSEYYQYAVERLGTFVVSLTRLLNCMNDFDISTTHFTNDDIQVILQYRQLFSRLREYLRSIVTSVQQQISRIEAGSQNSSYSVSIQYSALRGRPRFNIELSQLEYLASMNFNWSQIARMLGVSRMTLYRRRLEFGMVGDESTRSNVSDDELCLLIREIQRDSPGLGETMTLGRLRGMGVRATRSRVRECTRSLDPIGTSLRWMGHLTRRQPYSVPGPNSLWHIGEFVRYTSWLYNGSLMGALKVINRDSLWGGRSLIADVKLGWLN